MTRNEAIIYLFLAALGIAGFFIKGFIGGAMVGAACSLIFLAAVGSQIASRAAAKLDKQIRDNIINAQTDNYASKETEN